MCCEWRPGLAASRCPARECVRPARGRAAVRAWKVNATRRRGTACAAAAHLVVFAVRVRRRGPSDGLGTVAGAACSVGVSWSLVSAVPLSCWHALSLACHGAHASWFTVATGFSVKRAFQ